MPTVLRARGFRFYFVSFDGSEPVHVHVRKGDRAAKVWLSPLQAAWTDFSPHETREILSIVGKNADLIREKWHEHFGQA